MSNHWKIGLSILFLLGDICKILLIGKPRRPLTNGDVAVGLVVTTIFLCFVWWPQ